MSHVFVKEGDIIEEGFVKLPERAGFGAEMNEEAVRAAQDPGTPWVEASGGTK